ncbi:hypothetical protein PROVRETT_10138 [Providencia rettgeri DSM 1131]|nr:hypothetical protein PROVRETT_10138 [Providencia rettgeri DSM 1131]
MQDEKIPIKSQGVADAPHTHVQQRASLMNEVISFDKNRLNQNKPGEETSTTHSKIDKALVTDSLGAQSKLPHQ